MTPQLHRVAVLVAGVLAAAPVLAKPVTIEHVTWADAGEIDQQKKTIIKEFERQNPNIRVKMTRIDFSNYVPKLLAQMAAGQAPDVLMLEEGNVSYFLERKMLLDLEPYAKRDSLDVGGYVDAIAKNLYWDDKFVALAIHAHTNALFYNKSSYLNAGVAPPAMDWTWTDFLDVTKRLSRDTNGDGKPDMFGFSMGIWESQWGPFVWANGGGLFDRQLVPRKTTADTKETIEAVDFLKDLVYKHQVANFSYDIGGFQKGKVAMVGDGTWSVPSYRKLKSLSFDVTTFPRSPRTGKSSTRLSTGALGIWRGSKHKQEAWAFTKFMLSDYVQREKHKLGLFAPLMKKQLDWPELHPSNLQPESGKKVFVEIMKNGRTDTAYPTTTMLESVNRYMHPALLNKMQTSVAMASLNKELSSELNRVNSRKK